jgi:hypothetical protein
VTTIGTITVPAGTIHEASYETASWYTTFVHETQTVEVRLAPDGKYAFWKIEGRHTYEHFPSSFGGVQYGGGRMGPIDRPAVHRVQIYSYEAAAMVEAGTIQLADGYEIQERYFDHPISCSGYHYEPVDGRAVPVACEHDVHEDAHYQPTRIGRSPRGFLPFGYAPGVKERKRHIRIVAA